MSDSHLIRALPGFSHASIVEAIVDRFVALFHTPIKLPEPFGFALPTEEWPAHTAED